MFAIIIFLHSCILFDSGKITLQEKKTTQTPSVELISPVDGQVFSLSEKIPFQAEIIDQDSALEDIQVEWYSSITGQLDLDENWQSTLFDSETTLVLGEHTITVLAEDMDGNINSSAIDITVIEDNFNPICGLNVPESTDILSTFEASVVAGYAADEDNSFDELAVSINSNIDGDLGETIVNPDGNFRLDIQLSTSGEHTLELTVTDPTGATCIGTVMVDVINKPTAQILQPQNEHLVAPEEQMLFEGYAEDINTAHRDLDIEWISSIDALLYSGNPDSQGTSFLVPENLSFGSHTISFVVRNEEQVETVDSIVLNVNGIPVVDSLDMEPTNPALDEQILCYASISDPDGEIPTIDFEFLSLNTGTSYPPTTQLADGATLDLSLISVQVGERIQCTVHATDQWNITASASTNIIVGQIDNNSPSK